MSPRLATSLCISLDPLAMTPAPCITKRGSWVLKDGTPRNQYDEGHGTS